MSSTASSPPEPTEESLMQHISRSCSNCWAWTSAKSKTTKEAAVMKKLEYDLTNRKKKFGVEYMNLFDKEGGATEDEKKAVLDEAIEETDKIKAVIAEHAKKIDMTNEELEKIIGKKDDAPVAESMSRPEEEKSQTVAASSTKTETPAPAASTTTAPAPAPVASTKPPEPAPVSAPTEGVPAAST